MTTAMAFTLQLKTTAESQIQQLEEELMCCLPLLFFFSTSSTTLRLPAETQPCSWDGAFISPLLASLPTIPRLWTSRSSLTKA